MWVCVFRLCVLYLLAHAAASFAHEYSHSFMVWIPEFKANPLAINHGHWDLANILFQQEIDAKVNYDPNFASHHDLAAAAIALAGIGIGNAGFSVISQALFRRQVFKTNSVAQFFLFRLLLTECGMPATARMQASRFSALRLSTSRAARERRRTGGRAWRQSACRCRYRDPDPARR